MELLKDALIQDYEYLTFVSQEKGAECSSCQVMS